MAAPTRLAALSQITGDHCGSAPVRPPPLQEESESMPCRAGEEWTFVKLSVLFTALAVCGLAGIAWWSVHKPASVAGPADAAITGAEHASSSIAPTTDSQSSSRNGTESPQSRLHERPAQVELATAFNSTQDYFEFANSIADAAIHGDPTSAYYLSVVLEDCRSFTGLIRRATGLAEPQAALAAFQATRPGLLPEDREGDQRHLKRCARFFTGDPLDGYAEAIRQRTGADWLKAAHAGGDAAATADYLVRTAVTSTNNDPERLKMLAKEVSAFVQKAASSKDPRSIAALGRLLMHPDFSSRPLQGFAWLTAACNLGYDCSMANREIGLPCVHTDTCDPQVSVVDYFR